MLPLSAHAAHDHVTPSTPSYFTAIAAPQGLRTTRAMHRTDVVHPAAPGCDVAASTSARVNAARFRAAAGMDLSFAGAR